MGKTAFERRLAENEALAVARNLRVSPRKLNLLAQLIRGKGCERAIAELQFSQKRISTDVRKALVMKRFTPRARGRAARIEKAFSHLRLVLRERAEVD